MTHFPTYVCIDLFLPYRNRCWKPFFVQTRCNFKNKMFTFCPQDFLFSFHHVYHRVQIFVLTFEVLCKNLQFKKKWNAPQALCQLSWILNFSNFLSLQKGDNVKKFREEVRRGTHILHNSSPLSVSKISWNWNPNLKNKTYRKCTANFLSSFLGIWARSSKITHFS